MVSVRKLNIMGPDEDINQHWTQCSCLPLVKGAVIRAARKGREKPIKSNNFFCGCCAGSLNAWPVAGPTEAEDAEGACRAGLNQTNAQTEPEIRS